VTDVQFSDVYVHVEPQERVLVVSEMADRILDFERRERDYSITVPLALLLEAERAKRTRQIVLGSIAGISLLVGGIGIMNIMLASVTERTREIGIRLAVGARSRDILWQFLVEAVVLSSLGGLLGLVLGGLGAWTASRALGIPFVMPLQASVIAMAFSVLVGVVFGVVPARKASRLRPIEALRFE
jgi:putative ABC transport system permease protein